MTRRQPKRASRAGVDEYGRTPLHAAVMDGRLDEVRTLLDAGVDASVPDDEGWTPLHVAAANNDVDIAAALLARGVTVDAQDAHGNTPLFRAVFTSRGNGEAIQLLRAHGADARLRNKSGTSPLDLARRISNYDVAQYFIDLP